VNFLPENPYFASTLQTLPNGRFLNFSGAAQFIALLWPALAIWLLLRYPPPADESAGTPSADSNSLLK